MPTINRLPKAPRKTENSEKRLERQKMYNNSKWRKLRICKLLEFPLCERCLDSDLVVPAVDIHHIQSFMVDDENLKIQLFFDINNLKSLCKECHQLTHNSHK